MKSVVAQTHIFSSNLRIVCIVRFRDQNFLDDTVQGYYANQLKLTVFLSACNKPEHYNGFCDKRSIKQLFTSDSRVTTDKAYISRWNVAPVSYWRNGIFESQSTAFFAINRKKFPHYPITFRIIIIIFYLVLEKYASILSSLHFLQNRSSFFRDQDILSFFYRNNNLLLFYRNDNIWYIKRW